MGVGKYSIVLQCLQLAKIAFMQCKHGCKKKERKKEKRENEKMTGC
jgi:hypothetical protein